MNELSSESQLSLMCDHITYDKDSGETQHGGVHHSSITNICVRRYGNIL